MCGCTHHTMPFSFWQATLCSEKEQRNKKDKKVQIMDNAMLGERKEEKELEKN